MYIIHIYIYITQNRVKSGSWLFCKRPQKTQACASGSNPWYCTSENIWQMDGRSPKILAVSWFQPL